MAEKIKVLIADDHYIVRFGLAALLKSAGGFTIVGEAENGREAVEKAGALGPDIVIMDLMMPEMDGVEATRRILAPSSATDSHSSSLPRVLILTSFGTSADAMRAVEAGASGVLMKDAMDGELVAALHEIAAGGTAFSNEVQSALAVEQSSPKLTDRQLQVLELMVRGFTNPDIAEHLGSSVNAVKQIVSTICQKLDAANRTEAVSIALGRHLIRE